ncbi:MAG: MBL fold metallo-hydrolase [Leptolyngbyaceae cyanobacterium MO_188.B28]|nr:MBL fold metallo-hydrolase [Leptolyngbyaceae cyanobacterium MO_188.B28]
MFLTWLDVNTWLIELASCRILVDPWLVGPQMFGNLDWLFKGIRSNPRPIPERIDLILLSQGLEDHTHRATLAKLDHTIPVVASPSAAKVVEELGYTRITALAPGETFTLRDNLQIKATPGAPLGPRVVENGYILKALPEGLSLYYEPHGFPDASLKQAGPIDVVITPVIDLTLPLIGPIIRGRKGSTELAAWLNPQYILPTALEGDAKYTGLLASLIKAVGSADDLRTHLAEQKLSAQVLEPKPGDRTELTIQPRSVAA